MRRTDLTARAVPVYWVDAFAPTPFGGNPAAVCLLEAPVPAGAMQALAAEFGLSETAFVWPVPGGWSLRWFTPLTEVDLCGHATVAAAHAIREHAAAGADGPWGRGDAGGPLVFHTRSGALSARFDGELIEIDLPADPPVAVPVPDEVVGCWPSPVKEAAVGTTDLLLELTDPSAVRSTEPDLAAIAALPYRLVAVTAAASPHDGGADFVLRVFAPRVGIAEDPVTGSAQCLLAPYWAARLGRAALSAHQLSARGGRLRAIVDGDRVRVAGAAVTVVAGDLGLAVAAALGATTPCAATPRDAGPTGPTGAVDGRFGDAPPGSGDLRTLLASHTPGDDREVAASARFLAELDRLAAPLDRDADPVHVTASAVVVGPRGTTLHIHRRLRRWMQPGGHLEPGEAPPEAALREAAEETGLAVAHPGGVPRLIHLDVHEAAEGHVHLDLRYLLVAPDATPAPRPGESGDVAWFGWEEAQVVADDALVGALAAARRELGEGRVGVQPAGEAAPGDR